MSDLNGKETRLLVELEQAKVSGDTDHERRIRHRLVDLQFGHGRDAAAGWRIEETARDRPRSVRWLWHGRVPLGMVTLLCGAKSAGKSQIACKLAAAVTTGGTMPADGADIVVPQGKVVYLGAEDPWRETLLPRLLAAGADMGNLVHISRIVSPEGVAFPLTLAHHWDQIRAKVEEAKPLLFVTDTAATHLGCEFTIEECRPVMGRLMLIAEDVGCATLLVCHPVKVPHARASSDIPGGLSYGPRSVLLAGTTEGKKRRALFHLDCITPEAEPLGFQIEGETVEGVETSRVRFTGRTDLTLEEIRFHRTPKDEPAPDKGERFLRDVLARRPRRTRFVEWLARRKDIGEYALKAGRKKIPGLLNERIGDEVWLALQKDREELLVLKNKYESKRQTARKGKA